MANSSVVYCFLDTNILIHFHTFDEVEWLKVVCGSQVVLTLAPIVVKELNQQKNDTGNEWMHKRARTLVSKLKKLLAQQKSTEPVEIKSNIAIIDIPNEPMVDWQTLGLDPAVNDDRLIASIIKFKEQQPSNRVVLVTDDFLAQRKAISAQIEVIDPEGLIDIIERPSEEVGTIQKLERQVQELQRRIPEPRLSFWENGAITNSVTRTASVANAVSEDEISQQIAQKQQQLEQIVTKSQGIESDEKVEEFIINYSNYLKRFEQALALKRTKDYGLTAQFLFVLQNVGSAPAIDLELSLQFPKRSLVVGASTEFEIEFWGKVKIPQEPVPDWMKRVTSLDLASLTMPYISRTADPPEQPHPKGPLYNNEDRSIVLFTTPKLRHKEEWHLHPIMAFLPPETTSGFEIIYSLHADNLLDRIKGRLNVILQYAT